MFKYVAEIEMKNGRKFQSFGFSENRPNYADFVAIARDFYTDYPEAKSVVVSLYKDGKETFKETFICSELTNKQIREINDWVVDIDVDVDDLESVKYVSNIYGVEPQYAVGGYDYDEDEYWSRQLEKALSYLDGDMAYEYFDFAHSEDDDEAEEERLHNQVVAVLKAELDEYDVIGRE